MVTQMSKAGLNGDVVSAKLADVMCDMALLHTVRGIAQSYLKCEAEPDYPPAFWKGRMRQLYKVIDFSGFKREQWLDVIARTEKCLRKLGIAYYACDDIRDRDDIHLAFTSAQASLDKRRSSLDPSLLPKHDSTLYNVTYSYVLAFGPKTIRRYLTNRERFLPKDVFTVRTRMWRRLGLCNEPQWHDKMSWLLGISVPKLNVVVRQIKAKFDAEREAMQEKDKEGELSGIEKGFLRCHNMLNAHYEQSGKATQTARRRDYVGLSISESMQNSNWFCIFNTLTYADYNRLNLFGSKAQFDDAMEEYHTTQEERVRERVREIWPDYPEDEPVYKYVRVVERGTKGSKRLHIHLQEWVWVLPRDCYVTNGCVGRLHKEWTPDCYKRDKIKPDVTTQLLMNWSQHVWRYGHSTPLAARCVGDAWSRYKQGALPLPPLGQLVRYNGYRFFELVTAKSPQQLASYIAKYMDKDLAVSEKERALLVDGDTKELWFPRAKRSALLGYDFYERVCRNLNLGQLRKVMTHPGCVAHLKAFGLSLPPTVRKIAAREYWRRVKPTRHYRRVRKLWNDLRALPSLTDRQTAILALRVDKIMAEYGNPDGKFFKLWRVKALRHAEIEQETLSSLSDEKSMRLYAMACKVQSVIDACGGTKGTDDMPPLSAPMRTVDWSPFLASNKAIHRLRFSGDPAVTHCFVHASLAVAVKYLSVSFPVEQSEPRYDGKVVPSSGNTLERFFCLFGAASYIGISGDEKFRKWLCWLASREPIMDFSHTKVHYLMQVFVHSAKRAVEWASVDADTEHYDEALCDLASIVWCWPQLWEVIHAFVSESEYEPDPNHINLSVTLSGLLQQNPLENNYMVIEHDGKAEREQRNAEDIAKIQAFYASFRESGAGRREDESERELSFGEFDADHFKELMDFFANTDVYIDPVAS